MNVRPEAHDTVVRSGSVPLAVRDHGGDGPPVLLLHGAGGNLQAWDGFVPHLTDTYRIIAVDLRGHGRSGDGPWTWEAVLGDLEAVARQLGLVRPAVLGHSLGGILAAMWARRHPDCPAAVSLDGHRSAETYPENYPGLPPDQVRRDLAELKAIFDAQAAAIERPSPATSTAIRDSPEFKDSLPVFAEVTVPVLVVLATKPVPGVPPDLVPLLDALLHGVHRDFRHLARRNPRLRIHPLDASHGMVFEQPQQVAAVVREFLDEHVPGTTQATASDPGSR